MADKRTDLAGPGIGDYDKLDKILPHDYSPLLTLKETQKAIASVKTYIEANLCIDYKIHLTPYSQIQLTPP